jgi:hypothetical protein
MRPCTFCISSIIGTMGFASPGASPQAYELQ